MKTRVTITLDPDNHRLAKKRVRKKYTSASGLIESLIQSEGSPGKADIVASMTGSASLRVPSPKTDPLYDTLKAIFMDSCTNPAPMPI